MKVYTFNKFTDYGDNETGDGTFYYIQLYLRKYKKAYDHYPNSQEISDYLKLYDGVQIKAENIHINQLNEKTIVNIRTKTSIFNNWNTQKSKLSEINYYNMYEDYSFLKFILNDQSSFSIYLNQIEYDSYDNSLEDR